MRGRILGLIEAKAPGTRLENHVDQVLGYAFYESVEICALTTGLEWWLYLPGARVPVPKRRFAVLRIMEDPIELLCEDFNSFLGKVSVVNGKAEEQAKLRLSVTTSTRTYTLSEPSSISSSAPIANGPYSYG